MEPFSAALFEYSALFAALALCIAYLRSTVDWRARSRGLRLPPGPVPFPIVGNLFQIPRHKPWFGFQKLRAEYGDIVHLRVLREHFIVIGGAKMAKDFLEKHSANSADRPINPVIEMTGHDYNIVFMPYGQKWRSHRRVFWQHFHPGVVSRFYPIQEREVRKLLARLSESPSLLKQHIRNAVSAVMLRVVFDIDMTAAGREDLVAVFDEGIAALSLASPGTYAVELFPILRHVPSWLPGAGFRRVFARCRAANDHLRDALWKDVKASLDRGEPRPCVATDVFIAQTKGSPDGHLTPAQEELLKNICTATFEGGADTTFSAAQAVFTALALYPDAQKKAHAELDAIVGHSRLPNHADSNALVYVNAFVKETLRWHAGVPIGTVHRTMKDDEFGGYFIPAGTNVIPNVWEMLHDPKAYEDPFEFRPDRFIRDGKLDPGIRDPTQFMFGFGRRVCPGRYFAQASLFIIVASVLHVFEIGPPLDEDGRPIRNEYSQTHGFMSYPEDCRCTIRPRSPEAMALIEGAQRHGVTPGEGV